jgi:hypothetical protein
VTVVSKTQAATSDNAEFDRSRNLVIMTGNVALNDGPNITRGQKLTYDTVTGVANVEGGRVQGLFVPNDANKTDAGTPAPSRPSLRPSPPTDRAAVTVSEAPRPMAAPARPAPRPQQPGVFGRLRGLSVIASRRWPGPGQVAAIGGPGILAVAGLRKSWRVPSPMRAFYLRQGEAVGLLGPNGAGKTTIFYMITGLAADAGIISLDGDDITALPMYQRARLGIGYLPQEASIFRGLSVEDNIRSVLEVVEPDRKARERQLDQLLEEFTIARSRKAPSIALGRRAPPLRDRPRARRQAFLHPARRAVRRHRSDRGRRHPGAGAPAHRSRHRRAHHRSQCPRDARSRRSAPTSSIPGAC